MAITQALATSWKVEVMKGIHAFGPTVVRGATTADTFKFALYTSAANLSATTTVYTVTGEVSSAGTNYTAGGNALSATDPTSGGTTAFTDFADLTFSNVTLTARGAMIYNSTQGNRTVGVLDFGADKTATAGDFLIQFPVPDATNAIIRIA